MWFIKRNKEREEERAKKEREIERLKAESIKESAKTTARLQMLQNLLERSPDDVALRIFAATGGDKRLGK